MPPWTMPNWACPGLLTVTPATGRRLQLQEAVAGAAGPAQGEVERGGRGRLAGRRGEALVEHHRDVGPELRLDVDDLLRRQLVPRAVEVRLEAGALLGDLHERAEAEDLVAAAVGEDRPGPADEAMQAAALGDQVVAGTEIAGDRCWRGRWPRRPPRGSRWVTPRTAPRVPTGMNAGVSTRPCGVSQATACAPARPGPSA